MASGHSPLNPRRWFDRMQPQTLQIATWLLYLNGFFLLVDVVDTSDYLGYYRAQYGWGVILGVAVVALHAGGGWLMANDRRLGWKLAVVASFSPFVLRFIAYSDIDRQLPGSIGIYRKLTGGSTLNAIFEVALCALLLHPHSRQHQKIWYR
jgi:hypothetical protein